MRDPIFILCDKVRLTSLEIHRFLRSGHLEKIYARSLCHRLRRQGLKVVNEHPLEVRDEDGTVLGEMYADLFVEDCLMVEIKACSTLANEHIAQLLGYLRASGIEHGLLVNFGAAKLQIRKFALAQTIP